MLEEMLNKTHNFGESLLVIVLLSMQIEKYTNHYNKIL